jgi:carbonic anhydrase
LEIAVEKLGAKLIVVKGHSSCGAVASSFHEGDKVNTRSVTSKISRAITQCGCKGKSVEELDEHTIELITRKNIQNSIEDILESSAYLKKKIELNEIGIVSAYHDLNTGQVYFSE